MSHGEPKEEHYLTPDDFEKYLPWACKQNNVELNVNIIKIVQDIYTPVATRTRRVHKMKNIGSTLSKDSSSSVIKFNKIMFGKDNTVNINSIYDSANELVQIRFAKNPYIPRKIFKIFSLICQFYPHLTTITIDQGLDNEGLYELSKILSRTKVTDIILDNNWIPEANYYLLLENGSHLKYLSLARCSLNDAALEQLVSRISGISTLSVLNLSSNKITDVGAKYLGNLLRTDRKLIYLNLSGNIITDRGADSILSSLMEFPLTTDEIFKKRRSRLTYLRKNYALMQMIAAKRMRKSVAKSGGQLKKNKLTDNDNALNLIDTPLEPYNNPFKNGCTFANEGVLYCYGNNILSYLNLAFNNLSYFSVKQLYNVLNFQKSLKRQPSGLINVCIEGNNIPIGCLEIKEIDNMINQILSNSEARNQMKKKDIKSMHK